MTLYSIRMRRRTMVQKRMANSEKELHQHRPMRWKRKMLSSKISYSTFVQTLSEPWNEPHHVVEKLQIITVIFLLKKELKQKQYE